MAGRSRGFSEDGSSHTAYLRDLDVPHPTFDVPCLTTFCRLDQLGVETVGQRLEPEQAVIECRVIEPDQWCRKSAGAKAWHET